MMMMMMIADARKHLDLRGERFHVACETDPRSLCAFRSVLEHLLFREPFARSRDARRVVRIFEKSHFDRVRIFELFEMVTRATPWSQTERGL